MVKIIRNYSTGRVIYPLLKSALVINMYRSVYNIEKVVTFETFWTKETSYDDHLWGKT